MWSRVVSARVVEPKMGVFQSHQTPGIDVAAAGGAAAVGRRATEASGNWLGLV